MSNKRLQIDLDVRGARKSKKEIQLDVWSKVLIHIIKILYITSYDRNQ